MGQFNQLVRNRVIVGAAIAAVMLASAAIAILYASSSGRPPQLFQFTNDTIAASLPPGVNIRGTASFDKTSYLIGELLNYRITLLWREAAVTPDLDAFRNGIGFFPFNRLDVRESRRNIANGVSEYVLQIGLQAVDVEPVHSYQLAPPTIYYTLTGSTDRQLQSYRIEPPVVHIGEYYPADVSRIPLSGYKGSIDDPRLLRQTLVAAMGALSLLVAGLLLWYFGRVRRPENMEEPERLWLLYHSLDRDKLSAREFMDQCERVFTGLLRFRLNLSPVLFWSGGNADAVEWQAILQRARELFHSNYLPQSPGPETAREMAGILDDMFARLTEEERLRREQQPTFIKRVTSQYGALAAAGIISISGVVMLVLALMPGAWLSPDISTYNQAVTLLRSDQPVPDIHEQVTKLTEQITDPRIESAALYNSAILATRPELAGIDQPRQEALLAVMFQEQKVFLDALLHSLTMEDPFLLVSILRDSVRFLTISESGLKAATRIDPQDEQIHRNLELVMKRRNAYADSIEEILRGGEEDAGNQGELQKQALMDLEMFMETEMPDKYSEFEEGKNNKEYFIMEGF